MPEIMSLERRKLLAAYGARLVLTPGQLGMQGVMAKAQGSAASDAYRFVLVQKFFNPATRKIHHDITGPEIWASSHGRFDILIAAVGTEWTLHADCCVRRALLRGSPAEKLWPWLNGLPRRGPSLARQS